MKVYGRRHNEYARDARRDHRELSPIMIATASKGSEGYA